ncbi:MAG: glycosyltransferase family 2 protein, partial [Phycisphaerales bacterium]|nr:glycosyltransferase family 2 protein [Phycisphaerales bacterium]
MRTAPHPVPVDVTSRRVCAVVPCYDRPGDLERLLDDLREPHLDRLDVIVVDNASPTPIEGDARILRLDENTGGSGGFNAGIEAALRTDCEFVWLIDSDARVEASTLERLLRTLDAHPNAAAVGPAILEPGTNAPHEIGGHVDRRTGRFGPC